MQQQEAIEPGSVSTQQAPWKQSHRRPVLICSALLFAAVLAASITMVMPTKAAPRRERDADVPQRLEPSLKSVRDMVHIQDEDAGPELEEAQARTPEHLVIPPESGAAGALGSDASGRPAAPPSLPRREELTLEQKRQKQYDEYVLELDAQRYKMRLASLKGGTSVDTFDRARRAESEELAGLFGGQFGGEEGAQPSGLPAGAADVAKMASSAMRAMGQMGRGAPAANVPTGQANALLSMLGQGNGGTDPHFQEAEAQQQDKLDFFQNGGQQLPGGELTTGMKAAKPFTLLMGHEIRCLLVTKTVSEAPGIMRCVVSEAVRDRHRNLLIPQGTEAVGTYSARIAQGNARMQVAWTRLNFPDGQTLDLESMPGAETDGSAGLSDQVDRHIGKRIGAVLMSSAFTIGYQLTIPENGALLGSAVSNGLGQNVTNFGVDLAREIGRQSPVITLRQGMECLIMLNKDVSFGRPYDDGVDRSTVRRPAQ